MQKRETEGTGEHFFHYVREEREARLSEAGRFRHRENFWSRNRHLLMILIDILVITAVFLFLLPTMQLQKDDLAGYSFELKVVIFDGAILCSLRADGEEAAADEELTVTLRAAPSGREIELYGSLEAGQETVLRGRMPYQQGDQELEARISIASQLLTLHQQLPAE